MSDDSPLVIDEVVCNHCGKTFESLAEVGQHVAEQHKGGENSE